MVGREIDLASGAPHRRGPTCCCRWPTSVGAACSRASTFDLHRGEVLGFAGLIGAGRTDVGLALFGIEPATSGTIRLGGEAITVRSPREGMTLGIAYVSEDRRQLGLVLPMSIFANITLPVLRRYLNRFGLVRTGLERRTAEAFRKRLAIRAPSVDLPVAKLSGGNQQKVMLSKWLNTHPSILILDEPTRGVDVGSKAEVHAIIGELAAEGIGVIVISSDLPEVLAICDRVLVMREGRQMAILDRADADPESVMNAAMGQTSADPTGRRHELAAPPCQAGTAPRTQPVGADRRRRHHLRLVDRRLLFVPHLQSHRLQRRDHHRGGGRSDAGRADAQHRPVGRFDRRLHRLFRRNLIADHNGINPLLAVAIAIAIGAALGVVNGVLVAWGRVPAVIVTLGTLAIYRGVLVDLSGAKTVTTDSLPQWLVDLPRLDIVPYRRSRHPRACSRSPS